MIALDHCLLHVYRYWKPDHHKYNIIALCISASVMTCHVTISDNTYPAQCQHLSVL